MIKGFLTTVLVLAFAVPAFASANPKGQWVDVGTNRDATHTACPWTSGSLPTGFDGCFVKVLWAQIEPQSGVFDWTVIDQEIDADTSNTPIEVLVQTGETGTPNITAVCNNFTTETGAPACQNWLAPVQLGGSVESVETHLAMASGGIAQCHKMYDPYPGDSTYQAALRGLYSAWKSHFSTYTGGSNIVGVSVEPASDAGHNWSLSISSPCATGGATEYYASKWNTVAQNHGCTSGDETCWQTTLTSALESDWDDQTATAGFNQKNLLEWLIVQDFPSIVTNGASDSTIHSNFWNYMVANPPSGGHEQIDYEAQKATLNAANVLQPFATSTVPPGSQAAGLASSARDLCDTNITYGLCVSSQGSYINMREVQLFGADATNSSYSGVIAEIAKVVAGTDTCTQGIAYCSGL